MSEIKLKKGDKVVMHTCLESKGKNLGKVWTCHTDSFKCDAGIEVVFLEGFSGFFYTKFLQPIKLDSFCNERINSLEASLLDVSTQATKHIKELEQENTELKKWKEDTIKARGNDYMAWSRQNDQLTKAENIIRDLYFIIQGRIDYEDNIQIKDSMDLAKAFLNEVK